MIKQWLIQAAITFALRQLARWQGAIDWAKVKADMAVRVRELVPGALLDDMAVKLMESVVDMLAGVLSDQADLMKIVALMVDGKIAEAMAALKDLILEKFKSPVSDPLVDEVLASLA